MRTGSLWIIRLALTVQFLGVLSVPVLVAVAESPRRDEYIVTIMDANPESPKRAAMTIERAIDTVTGGR